MTIPAFPTEGSTDWFEWAAGVDTEARLVAEKADTGHEHTASEVSDFSAAADARITAAAGVTLATLTGGKVPSSQMPPLAIQEIFTVASQAAMLALAAERGDVAIRTDLDPDGWFILTSDSPGTLVDWLTFSPPGAVSSVAGKTGAVTLVIADVASLQPALDALAIVTANTQTGSYTLVLGDAGKVIEMNVASGNTLTVPPNSAVAFGVGTVIEVHQYGVGQTTITPGAGVTIRSDGAKLKTTAQYATAGLRKRATNEWVASGDLSA